MKIITMNLEIVNKRFGIHCGSAELPNQGAIGVMIGYTKNTIYICNLSGVGAALLVLFVIGSPKQNFYYLFTFLQYLQILLFSSFLYFIYFVSV